MRTSIMNQIADVDRSTLHRKDAPQTSVNAAYKVDMPKRARQVLGFIIDAGANGITLTELSAKYTQPPYSMPYGTLNARPSGLEKLGLIYYQGDTREGSRVMRAIEFKEPQMQLV